ncbi:hypothetical protein [Oceanidesulfovibrio marinus]|uniref:Uncharacterized protein n=1 Tax=Oceanidesulfovibrio marinus TaxID=370038 RepID=A0A6P1ZIU1_9BACT|nr:hypothetical protein [Oceanidesulfovibrio marinus]TVM35611.1 hypothetical protein DQK91_02805 [Oceanidesulfovibrio marinus]
MTRSKYEQDIQAALGRVNLENIDALVEVLRAFEDKWKDELVTLVTPEKVMRHQGRVQGLREIRERMKRAAT